MNREESALVERAIKALESIADSLREVAQPLYPVQGDEARVLEAWTHAPGWEPLRQDGAIVGRIRK